MKTVKAYAAPAAHAPLELIDIELPDVGPHDVEVAVTHCGICHSDVAMIDNEWHFSSYPLVAGHEVVGTISAVGSEVTSRKIGQRVGVGWHAGSCGECEWCERGKEHLCAGDKPTIVGRTGGFATHVICDAHFAPLIPDEIASDVAGPLMCAGNTVFGPILHQGVTAKTKAAVVGIGGLGHLAVQFLAAYGCEVTAISSTHDKDEEAKGFGASRFIATKGTDELKKAAGSFDFIISTVGADLPWVDYVNALRPEGKLVLVGLPPGPVSVPALPLIAGERSIVGGCASSPSDMETMLAFAARTGVKPMIEKFPLSDINAAVERTRGGRARFRVVVES